VNSVSHHAQTPSAAGQGNRLGWGGPAGRGLFSAYPVRGLMGMLGPAEGPSDLQWPSRNVGADQRQLKSRPRDQPDVGSMLLAPAQLE
jgi:hypothetical protein